MAGGLILAGLPILIHLLHRQRHKTVPWAAMRWLLAALKKNQRWIRLEQWTLLAVRTLVLALVVLAMMKPAFERAGSLFALAGPARHHVLVIDNTMSMQYREGSMLRRERARDAAGAVLDSARQGDRASVVVLGAPTHALVGEASPYLVSVAQEIESIRPQDGAARIEEAVEPLARILKASPASRRRVYLLTDMQRSAWFGEHGDADPADLARRLQSISELAEFVVIDVSGADSPNLAVVDVEQVDPLVVLGRPALIRAAVANFGATDRADVRLELRVDGEVEFVEAVDVPAGQRKVVAFSPVFKEAGDRTIEIRAAGDALEVDNSRWLVARVRQALHVLVVDGDPSSEPFRSETDYLRIALAPSRNDDGAYDLVRVDARSEADLLEERLDDWDLVVLANVAQVSPTEAKVLGEFVRRGGGLLLFLGSRVDLAGYNRVLHEDAERLMPVRLIEVVAPQGPDEAPFAFDPRGYVHPLVADFRDNEKAGLLTTRVSRYVRAEFPEDLKAEAALSFSNGDPAVVLSRFGDGVVGVATTSADLDWNAWAVSPSYVPVVQQLVQLLAAGRVRRGDARVGESIDLTLPEESFDVEAAVAPPPVDAADGATARTTPTLLRSELRDGVARLHFSDTDRAGVYRFSLGPPIQEEWAAAVNPWPAESDLTKLTEKDLRSSLPGWEFRMLDRWEDDAPPPTPAANEGGAIHRAVLYLVLGLVLLETILAWRFGRYR
jgi:hypothetical protein